MCSRAMCESDIPVKRLETNLVATENSYHVMIHFQDSDVFGDVYNWVLGVTHVKK
jgi:hypothetical protein